MNAATNDDKMLPALLGGPRAVTADQKEAMRWPILTLEDEAAVLAVMRDGDLSTHPVTRALEEDYQKYFGIRHALSHCNGTAALLAAFFALDLKPGDEVIVPSATWWSSVLPMMWLGAIPVFAETEPLRLGLDPEDIQRKITPRTRAIVVVHLWGMPSHMTEILEVARQHGLKVIEDASHAHGARWRGRLCGTLGDVAVFSLQGHKLAPAGEGGMLLTNSDSMFERAKLLGDVERILELPTASRRFAATSFGVKTRMSPLNAAVARVQLRHLDARNARRNASLEHLAAHLESLGFGTFPAPAHIQRVYFDFVFRAAPARVHVPLKMLVPALQAEGCLVEHPRYPLLHQQPFFVEGAFTDILRLPESRALPVYRPDALPQTEAANEQLLRLPPFPSATPELLDQYVLAFRKVLGSHRVLKEAHHPNFLP